jgi:hypothetical protein
MVTPGRMADARRISRFRFLRGVCTMRRLLSLPGLAIAIWVSCLALLGLLGIMLAALAWHPHFLPVTSVLAMVIIAGLALIVGALWRIIRGPRRREALSWLLLGSAPLWFLGGSFFYGLAIGNGRTIPINLAIKLMAPLGESVMDLEARFRYPQRTVGDKVVMISTAMPVEEARAQVAAMDRHVRALEARLGRATTGSIHWVRGPLLGIERHALFGLCLGSRPGEAPADAEGLCTPDRHEVAHCVLTSHCSARFDPPALLTEGWAQATQGDDPVDQATQAWNDLIQDNGLSLRQLTGPDWYNRHEWPVYLHGAPLVNFLLDRLGPERFLRLYTTCAKSTFELDCRRILGLDLDGLDAAYRADVERRAAEVLPVARRRLERLRLDPGIDAAHWKAFLTDYFAAAERVLAPYRNARVTAVFQDSSTDDHGRKETSSWDIRLIRSGPFASVRSRLPTVERARLAHPTRSLSADRRGPNAPWMVDDDSRRTRDESYQRALGQIDRADIVRDLSAVLLALSDDLSGRDHAGIVVAGFERLTEKGRPIMRVRFEDRSPPDWGTPWRVASYDLAADDFYIEESVRIERGAPTNSTQVSEFEYDRHGGLPIVRAMHTAVTSADGSTETLYMTITDRQFGPVPEDTFDPERFLDGPQLREASEPRPFSAQSNRLMRWTWLPFAAGTLCLVFGAGVARSRITNPLSSRRRV